MLTVLIFLRDLAGFDTLVTFKVYMQIKKCIKQELVMIRIIFVANMRELTTENKLHVNIN